MVGNSSASANYDTTNGGIFHNHVFNGTGSPTNCNPDNAPFVNLSSLYN